MKIHQILKNILSIKLVNNDTTHVWHAQKYYFNLVGYWDRDKGSGSSRFRDRV